MRVMCELKYMLKRILCVGLEIAHYFSGKCVLSYKKIINKGIFGI